MERFGISTEQLDALFERSTVQATADREARQRAAEWPSVIERVLAKLARRSAAQDEALAAIEVRIAVLETAAGTGRG